MPNTTLSFKQKKTDEVVIDNHNSPFNLATMKGLVYGVSRKIEWKDVPKPVIEKPTDALVKVLKTTICETDPGTLYYNVAMVKPGTVLGHEGLGVIEEVGTAVMNFKKGDHVIISCITSDGTCEYCKKKMYSHCEDGGWILGRLINGTQAEFVRIPHADNSLCLIPAGADEEVLGVLNDILPTGHEIGVLNGNVKAGDTIAIVGAGPIGMSILLGSQFYSPTKIYVIDVDTNRLEMAKTFGATDIINAGKEDVVKRIMAETKGGVDVAIEAVGEPVSFDICHQIVRPGGHVANIGYMVSL